MNVTPQVIKQVQAYVNSVGGTPPLNTQASAAIAAALNAANIPNPVTVAPQVPYPWNFLALMSQVSAASLGKLANYQYLVELTADLRNRDTVAAQTWAALLAAAGILSPAENAAIQTMLARTIPDPAWTAMTSWAQLNLGGPILANDVAQCYPNNG